MLMFMDARLTIVFMVGPRHCLVIAMALSTATIIVDHVFAIAMTATIGAQMHHCMRLLG
jgi:hypothetical protein